MKIKIGPYIGWLGPFQLAEKLLFWMDKDDDKVYKLGHFFAYGTYSKNKTVSQLLDEDTTDQDTWLYKLLLWAHNKQHRKVSIKIDRYDTYSMDHTLALIIVPMLKQLKETKHGSPHVDNEDVPKELHTPEDYDGIDTDENWHKRWEWVLGEMIWAFEQIAEDVDVSSEDYKEHYARVNRGTTLFGKYYQGLWD
jgi:hypothetical protein